MRALVHAVSPRMDACVRSNLDLTIDLERARAQHRGYCDALRAAGATVTLLDVNGEHPDAVFIEDCAVVLDEIAILATMGAPARRDEPAAVEAVLREHRRVVRLPPDATLEGGDVLAVGRTLLVGESGRTNAAGVRALSDVTAPFGYRVVPVRVAGCLHLKTACTALPDGTLLVQPAWLPDLAPLRAFERIDVDDDEPGAANVVVLGGNVIAAAAYSRTIGRIERHAVRVHAVALDELAKADGSATCLSIVFRDAP